MHAPLATTAVVLCGGRGRRLGGVDKPLLEICGEPLVARVIERLRPQTDAIVLACAAGNAAAYAEFGHPVTTDRQDGEGPLAGIAAVLPRVDTPWLLVAPGDTPFLPGCLVARLAPICHRRGAAVAAAGGRRQNLTMLLDRGNAASLAGYFAAGDRAAHRWLDAHGVEQAEFAEADFLNVNTPADMDAARRRLALARPTTAADPPPRRAPP